MVNLDLEKFNPTVAELQQLVESSRSVDIKDLKQVKEKRISLKNMRVVITKKGKELREDALAFQKAVIAKEKELVAIIEPEEARLQGIEDEAEKLAEMEKRKVILPARQKTLAEINDGVQVSDEELLAMDGVQFMEYTNKRRADKLSADELAIKERENKLKEAEDAQRREKETQEREEKARQEERLRIEREKKEEEDRLEKQREQERKQLEMDTAYQAFLKEHGVVAGSDEWKIERLVHSSSGRLVRVYKFVAEFKVE